MREMIMKMSVLVAAATLTAVGPVAAQNSQSNQAQQSSDASSREQAPSSQPNDRSATSDQSSHSAKSTPAGSEHAPSAPESSRYIDYQVVTAQAEKIGTVETLWEDATGQPAYLGVKRPQQEKLTLIPADHAQVNHARRTIRLSLSSEALQSAPTVEQDAELDEQTRQKLVFYFVSQQQQQAQQQQPGQSASQTAQSGLAAGQVEQRDQATIRLKQEQATVGTRMVEAGGVLLRKVVRTETNREPVILRSEELVIERVPGGGEKAASARLGEDEIFIPLRREVPVVQKDVIIKETVRVGKDVQEQKTNVTTRLREEELQIQRQGQPQGTGAPGSVSTGRGSEGSPNQPGPARPQTGQNQPEQNPEEK